MPRSARYKSQAFGVRTKANTEDRADSLVASARRFIDGSPGIQKLRRNGRQSNSNSWQNELWDYYDSVPEFRAGCTWVGNLLSKGKLYVAYKGERTTTQAALDAAASLFGGEEGQEEMMRLLGINFTVAGEGWIVGEPKKKEDEWSVVASVEVGGETTSNMTVEGERVEPGTIGVRLWRRHPRKSEESDCNARALINELGMAVRLAQVINAMSDSRLKGNGILFVPSELELPNVNVTMEDEDGNEVTGIQANVNAAGGLTKQLIKIASVAMMDRDSAAASVPLVVAVPGEFLKEVNWVDFWTGFDEHIKELRDDVTKRIGIGMEMPPEALTGTADMNHWGAFAVDEQAIKVHVEPLLAVIMSSLTTGYLIPYLLSQGVEDAYNYTFEADTSAMRVQPNRSKESIELFDRGALSAERMLIENGFNPATDSPDEKERIMFFLSKIARTSSASPEQLSAVLDRLGIPNLPVGDEPRGALAEAAISSHPVREAPQIEDSEAVGAQASAKLHAPGYEVIPIDGLVMASEQMVHRALERCGNRLKAKVGRSIGASAADLYMSVPTMDYAECEAFLQDAWTSLDRFEYPGVSTAALRSALHEYTLMLLRSQKPLTRPSLARHLMLELAEAA